MSLLTLVMVAAFPGLLAAEATQQKKVVEIGVVLRLKDKFNDTIAGINMGIDTAKTLYEKLHPDTQVILHRISHGEDLSSLLKASKEIVRRKLTAVIGGELSEEAFFLREQFKSKKIVLITPTASNPTITDGFSFTFRMCLSDEKAASQLAQITLDRLKPKAIGVVHNVSSIYTDYLSQRFINEFEKLQKKKGTQIPVYDEKVIRDTVSFENQIQTFIEKNVTHVVIPSHPIEFLRFVSQATDKRFFPVYVGSDGWGSNEHVYRHLVVDSRNGAEFTAIRGYFWKENKDTQIGLQFQTEYMAKFKTKPTAWGALGFDSAWLLISAMSQLPSPTQSELLKVQLKQIKNLELVTQPGFSFAPDGGPLGSMPIYKISSKGIQLQGDWK